MPYNGSGGTSQPASSIYPAVGATLIESAKFNISIADIYTMLGTAVLKDGQQVCTQRIPFAQGIQVDSVTEKTADTGVTLDGVLLKDGRIDTTQGADIVCAATINLETATGNVVDVTGSTGPVTAITLSQGHWRVVRFTGTPTLTNGASLVLPGGANIVVAAGDYAIFAGYATGVVRCLSYVRAHGGPLTMSGITNTLAADVNLNNTGLYFDGPSVAQGTTGTWFASGSVVLQDTAGAATFIVKLWDGTTVIASCRVTTTGASADSPVSLSGRIASPAGNIRISVKDGTSTSGLIKFNISGESKDSTLTAFRIA